MPESPTIVLVRGAFAGSASWAPVTLTLMDQRGPPPQLQFDRRAA